VVMKKVHAPAEESKATSGVAESASAEPKVRRDASAQPGQLPKLVDLGADKCIPCKMMAPILESLKQEYAGRMDVQFIDVWKNPEAGKRFGVEMIPTQIFYDSRGKELYRHTGFFGKEDILAKWEELGVDMGTTSSGLPIVREAPVAADGRPPDRP